MEFLYEYGLFAAKLITFLIGFLLLVAAIAGISQRHKREGDGHLEINNLNDKYSDLAHALSEATQSADDFKKQLKQERKEKKRQNKASKKESDRRKRVYVLDFDGDIKASEVDNLREEVSAVLLTAEAGDEVVLRLESSGGMVHSYGLAASQLQRIKDHQIPLTVIVDKVAASGGYMMACIANQILAGPFAVIGSIGVLAQVPNFHRLLKKHDIDVELHTAGEYKRTLTLFGENSDKAREKFREELEKTHGLFKQFVTEHRDAVNIEEVSTGEVWYGKQALDCCLIDGISTSDQYLLDQRDQADLYEVKYVIKKALQERIGLNIEASLERLFDRLMKRWQENNLR